MVIEGWQGATNKSIPKERFNQGDSLLAISTCMKLVGETHHRLEIQLITPPLSTYSCDIPGEQASSKADPQLHNFLCFPADPRADELEDHPGKPESYQESQVDVRSKCPHLSAANPCLHRNWLMRFRPQETAKIMLRKKTK